MKKLMSLAVVAAATAASAAVCVTDKCGEDSAGSAYKVTISLKTTDIKSKEIRVSQCDDPECTYWREQKTLKINGLLWAKLDDCLCGWINDEYNYAFWTKDGAVLADDFGIGVGLIGKPDKNGFTKKIEAYGGLSGEEFGELTWAGFGSAAVSVKSQQCEDPECSAYVKSISGGIAGKLRPADFEGECEETCEEVEYAECCDAVQLADTAAYGTIKISYDKSTSKKVALADEDAPISAFYKVPAAAAADLEAGTVTIEE